MTSARVGTTAVIAVGASFSTLIDSAVPLLGASWILLVAWYSPRRMAHYELKVTACMLGLALIGPLRILEYTPGTAVWDVRFVLALMCFAMPAALGFALHGALRAVRLRRFRNALLCLLSFPCCYMLSSWIAGRLISLMELTFK